MGSGKTTAGARVAQLVGAEFVDLDHEIEAVRGQSIPDLFAQGGESWFRSAEREVFAGVLAPDRVIALGGGAPLQEPIWKRVKAEALSVFLEVPLDMIRARLGDGAGRPLAGGDLDELLRERLPRYREADRTVDGSRAPDVVAQEVAALWSE